VTIVAPPTDLRCKLGSSASEIGEGAIAQMRDADPFGTFVLGRHAENSDYRLVLCIGDDAPGLSGTGRVFINSAGWLAGISRVRPVSLPFENDENCFGAIAAACLGVTQVFKLALGMAQEQMLRDGLFDLFRLAWTESREPGPWPSALDVGRVLMVGAGSVASSAAYAMRLAGLNGHLTILDKDVVKIQNFNRSPLFGMETLGLAKADAISIALRRSGLEAHAVPIWWNDFVERQARETFDFDVWLPLANEFGVRGSMQHNVPPLMIHASTSANWGVNHGRHLPATDDCLVDRFPREVAANDMRCAEGEAVVEDVRVDAALPFASLFAGLLVAVDLLRANCAEFPQVPNFTLLDFYGSLEEIQKWDRRPRVDCICREQHRLHERYNARTRHWGRFRFAK
jgi:hypothetical protein